MAGKNTTKKKRPIAVTLIALVTITMILLRFFLVGRMAVDLRLIQNGFSVPMWRPEVLGEKGIEYLYGGARLILGLIGIIVLIAFFRMKRWSWVALMMWVGISLTIGLDRYFFGNPKNFNGIDYFVMASDTTLAFLLNQAEVQKIFGIRSDTGERL